MISNPPGSKANVLVFQPRSPPPVQVKLLLQQCGWPSIVCTQRNCAPHLSIASIASNSSSNLPSKPTTPRGSAKEGPPSVH